MYLFQKEFIVSQLKKSILLASSVICAFTVSAQEQPKAEDLVGKTYIGIHGTKINTDDDRLTDNGMDFIKHAKGFGVEIGHRFTESAELRLSYTDLNLDSSGALTNNPSGANIALNYLYFPTQENLYLMAGASSLDVIESKMSVNLGAGYRHYMTERSAIYFEGNGHYQLDNTYTDLSAQIGLIYFFGDTPKKVARTQPAAVAPAKAVAPMAAKPIDTDGDGVIDSKDQCKATPADNKVDSQGCTIFNEENDELNLHVNFDNSKANIKAEYLVNIKAAAEFLNKYQHTNLAIIGHTSSQGPAAFNKKLSQQRAEAIVDVLVNKFGIDASRLTAKGMGEEALLNTANNAKAHAENRRIEAKVSVKNKVAVKR